MYPKSFVINFVFLVLLTLQAMVDPSPENLTFNYIVGAVVVFDLYLRQRSGKSLVS